MTTAPCCASRSRPRWARSRSRARRSPYPPPRDAAGGRTLLYAVSTDADGLTPPLPLDAPPRADSLSPAGGPPYALYTVEVTHPGYTPRTALHVAMFAGVPAMLPVVLTPLEENQPAAPTDLTAAGDPQALYHTGEED